MWHVGGTAGLQSLICYSKPTSAELSAAEYYKIFSYIISRRAGVLSCRFTPTENSEGLDVRVAFLAALNEHVPHLCDSVFTVKLQSKSISKKQPRPTYNTRYTCMYIHIYIYITMNINVYVERSICFGRFTCWSQNRKAPSPSAIWNTGVS